MATSVTITGTGTPMVAPGRAGPGALVQHGDIALQVDAGRATTLRLAEAGLDLADLTGLLLTHHHSDHMVGVPDVVLTRWIANGTKPCPPLPVHCPDGRIVEFIGQMFAGLEFDISSRTDLFGYPSRPEPDVHTFAPSADAPVHVATFDDIVVEAVAVDHGNVEPAVAYRFSTPDGVIVISGDTAVCPQLEGFAQGADILVHEAFSPELMTRRGAPPARIEHMRHLHSDVGKLGAMAARLEVPQLVVTHLIPAPPTPEAASVYVDGIRAGGYEGDLVVADDLHTAQIPGQEMP